MADRRREKLSKAMGDQLRFLFTTDVYDVTNESVVKALARRGLAERYVPQLGPYRGRHCWRITDAGRAALKDDVGG